MTKLIISVRRGRGHTSDTNDTFPENDPVKHTLTHTWLAGTAVVLSFISLSEVSTGAIVLAGLHVTRVKLLTEDPRIPLITLAVKRVLRFTFKHAI